MILIIVFIDLIPLRKLNETATVISIDHFKRGSYIIHVEKVSRKLIMTQLKNNLFSNVSYLTAIKIIQTCTHVH